MGKPNEQYQKKEKTSKYKGVSRNTERGTWIARLQVKGQKPKHSGTFKDEMDAAKRLNQLCEELGIHLLNPEISTTPHQPYQHNDDYQTNTNPVVDYEILQTENHDTQKKKR